MRRIVALLVGGLFVGLCLARLSDEWVVRAQTVNTVQVLLYGTYQFNTFHNPSGLAVVPSPFQLWIADAGNHKIWRFTVGVLSPQAGTGTPGYVNGTPQQAQFNHPTGLTVLDRSYPKRNPDGGMMTVPYYHVYINDASNYVVRRFCKGQGPLPSSCSNVVETAAGNHEKGYVNGPAASAQFAAVGGISRFGTSTYYIADVENHTIRLLDSSGNVSTFAGTGSPGFVNGFRTAAQFNVPAAVTWDSSGNLYIADSMNHVIRKVDTSGNVTTLAGTGQHGYVDGPGWQAQFNMPCGIAYNLADNFLYVADMMNNVIRRVDLSGNVSTYAGGPSPGFVNGPLTDARFQCPTDLVISGSFMYISDTMNNVIRRVDMVSGIVTTYIS